MHISMVNDLKLSRIQKYNAQFSQRHIRVFLRQFFVYDAKADERLIVLKSGFGNREQVAGFMYCNDSCYGRK